MSATVLNGRTLLTKTTCIRKRYRVFDFRYGNAIRTDLDNMHLDFLDII